MTMPVRCRKAGRRACMLMAAALLMPPAPSLPKEQGISASWHYRNLLVHSRTAVEGKGYYLDGNRLRLEVTGTPLESVTYDIQYDNHFYYGDYISTDEFMTIERTTESVTSEMYWDLEEEISRGTVSRWSHELYRAYVTMRRGYMDFTLGRQRIAWGKGWFWSPLDMFNAVAPTAIERDERRGADGARLELSTGPANKVSFIFLPQRKVDNTLAFRGETLIGSYDMALSLGSHRGRNFAGVDFAGYIGDGGIYGEIVSFEQTGGGKKTSLLLSGNYNFENSVYIMIEYFHGGGTRHISGIRYEGDDYTGLHVSYDLTPLTKWSNYLIVNLSDGSLFFSPAVTSSLKQDLDLSLGVQFFGGGYDDEFGRINNIYYLEVDCYF